VSPLNLKSGYIVCYLIGHYSYFNSKDFLYIKPFDTKNKSNTASHASCAELGAIAMNVSIRPLPSSGPPLPLLISSYLQVVEKSSI